jgi:hypothetical protein
VAAVVAQVQLEEMQEPTLVLVVLVQQVQFQELLSLMQAVAAVLRM